jgi:hypothetical protein
MFPGDGGEGEQLMKAFRFQLQGDPDACDGWAYNWDYTECSTAHPTPRDEDGYSTMFLTCNNTDSPVQDFKSFLRAVNQSPNPQILRGGLLKLELSNSDDGDDSKRTVIIKQDGNVVLEGFVTAEERSDPNVGSYAMLESKSMHGMHILRIMSKCAHHGYCAIIDHVTVEFDVQNGCKLVATSGRGPDNEQDKGLATRFSLYDAEKNEVARCHLSYRDGSWDPSIAPTVEMIAVHKDYRGKGHLPVLWHWVHSFVQENFTLECMNNDTSPGNVMVKATQLTNAEIERHDSVPVTDKDFFYEHIGFSVRQQKGITATMFSANRPKDEEAVFYFPLLSRAQVNARAELSPSDGGCSWTNDRGDRSCESCGAIAASHLRCARCRTVFYCSKACQKTNWTRGGHKKWCGKTRDELQAILVERGLMSAS